MRRSLSIDPGRTAAIFIDLQEEHRKDERYLVEGYDRVLANVRRLQAAARRNGARLYHCAYVVDAASASASPFHPVMADGTSAFSDKDDPSTALCAEVAPAAGERLIVKERASAFSSMALVDDITAARPEWLIVAGVWTEACVDATVKDAIARGFRVLLVKDACGSATAAMHQTGILNLANRLYGGAVVDTDDACRLLDRQAIQAWQIEGSIALRFTYEDAAALYGGL